MNKKPYLIFKEKQLEAMFHILNETDIHFYRKVCRWYSEKFHTPLHLVMDDSIVAWSDILLHYYETQFEEIGFNSVYELACQEYIPELKEQRKKEDEDFAKALEEEQLKTLERKQNKLNKKIKNAQKKLDDIKPPAPVKMSFEDEEV